MVQIPQISQATLGRWQYINFLGHMLVVYTVAHFGRIILLLHLIWLELHTIMSTELSWGLKGCMGIVYLVNMSQRKLTSSLRGRLYMSSNTIIAPYISSLYFMFARTLCAKWNRDTFVLR